MIGVSIAVGFLLGALFSAIAIGSIYHKELKIADHRIELLTHDRNDVIDIYEKEGYL